MTRILSNYGIGSRKKNKEIFPFFKKDFIYLYFRERARVGEKEGEKHQCMVASRVPPTGDLAHNPGMHPNWELNRQPFGSEACTQSTKLYQPGP